MSLNLTKLVSFFTLLFIINSSYANKYADVKIKVIPASDNVYMLKGAGGNIAVLATSEGLLLVDDQFAPLAERIEKAMKSVVDKPLKYIVNTHYHGDHTGSNSYFSHQAPIFAHENVRERLKNKNKDKADAEKQALPVVTYKDGINIFLDNETIQLTHLENGHTDGDTIVYFNKANVLHTGDLFFAGAFPYIDLKSGGSVKGYLAAVTYMLEHTPDDVVIIPGHGKLTNKSSLKAFAQMIEFSMKLVNVSIEAGMSEAKLIEKGLPEKYQTFGSGFINEEHWLKTLYSDLSAQ
jgi:glyoxylase-like metal-dependent hydrolase (beta-lactamase superfamily II)